MTDRPTDGQKKILRQKLEIPMEEIKSDGAQRAHYHIGHGQKHKRKYIRTDKVIRISRFRA